MRTETALTDLLPEFRAALQEARSEYGWDQQKVQLIVGRAYAFLGPFVSAHIQRGSSVLGAKESEFLVVEFNPPTARDLTAAEEAYQRACELANSGNVRGALTLLQEVVRVFPEVAKYHRNLGQAHLELGHLDEAEDEFLRALALDSRDIAALIMLGNHYQARSAPEKAVPLYRRAIELQPDVLAFTNLGAALGKLGDLDGAVDAFRQALKLDPGFANANVGLQTALSQKLRK